MKKTSASLTRITSLVVVLLIALGCQNNKSDAQVGRDWKNQLSNSVEDVYEDFDLLGLSVALIEEGQISWQGHYGTTHPDSKEEISYDTKYRIASISKIVTAIAAMQLVEQGKINLDQDVSTYLGWKLRNPHYPDVPISLRQLLSHTSSIRDGGKYSNFSADMTEKKLSITDLFLPQGDYYTEDLFDTREPGSYFSYTNCTWGLVASIVEIISGKRFDVYTNEYIFSPLNISASFNIHDFFGQNPLSGLYRFREGSWINQVDDYRNDPPPSRLFVGYEPGQNGLLFGPQGNLRASSDDLVVLGKLFIGRGTFEGTKIISESSLNTMIQKQWEFNGSNGDTWDAFFNAYGLGVHILSNQIGQDIIFPNLRMVGHAGIAYGLLSDLYVDLDNQTGIVFIINGSKQEFEYGENSTFYAVEEAAFQAVYPYLASNRFYTN